MTVRVDILVVLIVVTLSAFALVAWLIDRDADQPRRASTFAQPVTAEGVSSWSTRSFQGPAPSHDLSPIDRYRREAIDAMVPFWAAASQGRRQAAAQQLAQVVQDRLNRPWSDDTGSFRAICA